MSREGKRLSGKQWNRRTNEDVSEKLDAKKNSKRIGKDRSFDDWSDDDYSFPDDMLDDDLYYLAEFEDRFDEEVDD